MGISCGVGMRTTGELADTHIPALSVALRPHAKTTVSAMDKGTAEVQKWTQLNIFTGEPIPPHDEVTENQQRIPKITQLALEVQFSIARLDALTDTMKLISELCERITGIASPIDIDERKRVCQKKQQQQTKRAITAAKQPEKRKKAGRPKGTAQLSVDAKKRQGNHE